MSGPRAPVLESADYAAFKTSLSGSGCVDCALSASRTRIVVDRGNPEASVLIIGEAPGRNEDLQGKAFVGRAGRLLDQMLAEQGFETDREALVVNVVKCRPPDNRPPRPEETAACRPYFLKQLSFVHPKVVLLLGATAFRHIVPERKRFSMAEEAGRFLDVPQFPGAKVMVLYHPAFILRDPRKRPLMSGHLARFKAHLDTGRVA